MTFRETYRSEVNESRRDRSRRACFWAKVVSIVLMVTIGATLRAEPQLRAALASVAMNTVLRLAGTEATTDRVVKAPEHSPENRIKINRH